MKAPLLATATLVMLTIAGCNKAPVLDCSSDSALAYSIREINSGLNDDEKKQFTIDCMTLTSGDAARAMVRAASDSGKGKAPLKHELFQDLNGCSFAEIHRRANKFRADSQAKGERDLADRAAEQARAELAAREPAALALKAVEEIKNRTALYSGQAKSQPPKIVPDQAGIKKLGEKDWQVEGTYIGPDERGAKIEATWKVSLTLSFSRVECRSVDWVNRKTLEPAPEKLLAAASPVPPSPSPARPSVGAPAEVPAPAALPTPKSKMVPTAGAKGKGNRKASPKVSDPIKKAAEDLRNAQAVEEAGQTDNALRLYHSIVRDYSGTQYAEKAQDSVDRLNGKPMKKK